MKKTLILIIIFLVIGSYIIISAYDLSLQEKDDRKTFISKVWDWFKQIGSSTKDTVGYVIGLDWLPDVDDNEVEKKAGE